MQIRKMTAKQLVGEIERIAGLANARHDAFQADVGEVYWSLAFATCALEQLPPRGDWRRAGERRRILESIRSNIISAQVKLGFDTPEANAARERQAQRAAEQKAAEDFQAAWQKCFDALPADDPHKIRILHIEAKIEAKRAAGVPRRKLGGLYYDLRRAKKMVSPDECI